MAKHAKVVCSRVKEAVNLNLRVFSKRLKNGTLYTFEPRRGIKPLDWASRRAGENAAGYAGDEFFLDARLEDAKSFTDSVSGTMVYKV